VNNPPQLLPTMQDGEAPGLRYRIQGELVPVLHVWLDGTVPVYFEHHVVLWKDPALQIGMRGKGGFKRMLAGLPVFQTEARGPGEIAFSRDDAGHVFPLHLPAGASVLVREHQYLAASGNLDYTYQRIKGFANMMVGNSGFFIDQFTASQQEGVLWLHGYGNVFEKTLAPGEQIDVEPGGWIYRDGSVQMEQTVYGLRTGIFGGQGNIVWNRFTGPGKVGIQSMYVHYPTEE
jgi:uncharacterized protein (AIM24 family)